jgi:hypothetical protein
VVDLETSSDEGDEDDDEDEARRKLFSYSPDDTCAVGVESVFWPIHMSEAPTEVPIPTPNQLNPSRTFRIPAGYKRLLRGLIREIEFVTIDKIKSCHCVFRAIYLIMVLDFFAEELERYGTDNTKAAMFRSRVLNPIMQRQSHGLYDHSPKTVRALVGTTKKAAARFYLDRDPLLPQWIPSLRRGILYIWPVRSSLLHLFRTTDQEGYDQSRKNTDVLLAARGEVSDEEFSRSREYYDFELAIVNAENLPFLLLKKQVERVSTWLPPKLSHADAFCPEGGGSSGGCKHCETYQQSGA